MSQALYEVRCEGKKHLVQVLGSTPYLLDHTGSAAGGSAFEASDEAMVLKAIECLPASEREQACQVLVDSLDTESASSCYVIGACVKAYGPNLLNFEFNVDKLKRLC